MSAADFRARIVATIGRMSDERLTEGLRNTASLGAYRDALLAESAKRGRIIHLCDVCGFPIVDEEPHSTNAGEDCHAACCPICNDESTES